VTSVAPSAILTIIVATMTFASSDLNVTVTSYFFFGPREPYPTLTVKFLPSDAKLYRTVADEGL
jgi:hypothetical protein